MLIHLAEVDSSNVATSSFRAVATRMGPATIARLSLAAYRHVAKDVRAMRPWPLDLGKPADRWRLRLVIYDAAHDHVWPERRQPFAGLPKSAKMRKGNYIRAHKCASAVLQEALHGGRKGFRKALWYGPPARRAQMSAIQGPDMTLVFLLAALSDWNLAA